MWKWIRAVFASNEPARNKAGDIIVPFQDRTYSVTCVCCEHHYYVTGRKVMRCTTITGYKAKCPLCTEVNFFDDRDAV